MQITNEMLQRLEFLDRICLRGIRATGYHGVFAHEKDQGQTFQVDADLYVDTTAAGQSDDLTQTVDYGQAAKLIEKILSGPAFDLIEALGQKLADSLLELPGVQAVKICLHKPQAPLGVPADDVNLTIWRGLENLVGDTTEVATSGEPTLGRLTDRNDATGRQATASAVDILGSNDRLTSASPRLRRAFELAAQRQAEKESFKTSRRPAYLQRPQVQAPTTDGLNPIFNHRPSRPTRAIIALGGNLGEVPNTLRSAIKQLRAIPGVGVMAVSSLYRTKPVLAPGQADQPDYFNAVVMVQTVLSARELWEALVRIEYDHGRVRNQVWGPRTLDLDLIDYRGLSGEDPQLILPHPRALQRAFVLVPWAEIEPVWAATSGEAIDNLTRFMADTQAIIEVIDDWLPSAIAARKQNVLPLPDWRAWQQGSLNTLDDETPLAGVEVSQLTDIEPSECENTPAKVTAQPEVPEPTPEETETLPADSVPEQSVALESFDSDQDGTESVDLKTVQLDQNDLEPVEPEVMKPEPAELEPVEAAPIQLDAAIVGPDTSDLADTYLNSLEDNLSKPTVVAPDVTEPDISESSFEETNILEPVVDSQSETKPTSQSRKELAPKAESQPGPIPQPPVETVPDSGFAPSPAAGLKSGAEAKKHPKPGEKAVTEASIGSSRTDNDPDRTAVFQVTPTPAVKVPEVKTAQELTGISWGELTADLFESRVPGTPAPPLQSDQPVSKAPEPDFQGKEPVEASVENPKKLGTWGRLKGFFGFLPHEYYQEQLDGDGSKEVIPGWQPPTDTPADQWDSQVQLGTAKPKFAPVNNDSLPVATQPGNGDETRLIPVADSTRLAPPIPPATPAPALTQTGESNLDQTMIAQSNGRHSGEMVTGDIPLLTGVQTESQVQAADYSLEELAARGQAAQGLPTSPLSAVSPVPLPPPANEQGSAGDRRTILRPTTTGSIPIVKTPLQGAGQTGASNNPKNIGENRAASTFKPPTSASPGGQGNASDGAGHGTGTTRPEQPGRR